MHEMQIIYQAQPTVKTGRQFIQPFFILSMHCHSKVCIRLHLFDPKYNKNIVKIIEKHRKNIVKYYKNFNFNIL